MPKEKEREPLLSQNNDDEVGRKLKEPLKSQPFMKDFFRGEEDRRRRLEEQRIEAENQAETERLAEIEAKKRWEQFRQLLLRGLGILLLVAVIGFAIFELWSSSPSPTLSPTPSPTIHFNERTLPPSPAPTLTLSPTVSPTIDFDQRTPPPSPAPTIDFDQRTRRPSPAPSTSILSTKDQHHLRQIRQR